MLYPIIGHFGTLLQAANGRGQWVGDRRELVIHRHDAIHFGRITFKLGGKIIISLSCLTSKTCVRLFLAG